MREKAEQTDAMCAKTAKTAYNTSTTQHTMQDMHARGALQSYLGIFCVFRADFAPFAHDG
jgi:hypothetical protein